MNKNTFISFMGVVVLSSCAIQQTRSDSDRPGEILVDLAKGVDPKGLEATFKAYALEQEKVVSSSLNIILYNFNAESIKMEKLIKKVKKEEGVENAQSNKTVTKRN